MQKHMKNPHLSGRWSVKADISILSTASLILVTAQDKLEKKPQVTQIATKALLFFEAHIETDSLKMAE